MSKKNIVGSGGGPKAHTAVDAPNTLRSRTTARVLFLTSRGEIGGLVDQTNPMKSVFFNNTPVMNADGTSNFTGMKVEERYGLPSQTVMAGYPSASNTSNVGQKVTTTTPVTYTTSTATIDAVRVTVRFPALFTQATNGDTNGATVQFRISTKLGAGAFTTYGTYTKTAKSTSPADADYQVLRPSGAGVWSVKVERITADNALTTLANDIYFQFATEIQNAQLPYNGYAYNGLTVSAETTGSTFPLVAFDLYGRKIAVPSNYNVSTRIYTGTWDGTFAASKQVCDNPAWVLYDLLTDVNAGMGSIISTSDIDKYSFYAAAQYNDGLVPTASGGGTEPRYTFNYQFMEQSDAWSMLQNVAASFGSVLFSSGNKVRLVQDRPTGYSRVISNSNVIEDSGTLVQFSYTSSARTNRSSACIVYWNDPAQNWLSVPAYYEDATATTRYGLNVATVTGLGITSEGQALRLAKWTVDTSINNTDAVIFKVGPENAGMEPGEVLKLMDTDYAAVMNEAKVVSSTATTVTFDRAITVASGNTFDIVKSDGISIETRTITSTGTSATVTYTGAAIAVSAGAVAVITGATSPRFFKVTNVKEDSAMVWTVSAVQYDPNKFGRVDNTPTGLVPQYQAQSSQTVVTPVTGITFGEESYTDVEGRPKRNLSVKFTPPAGQYITNYVAFWDKDNGNSTQLQLVQPNFKFPVDTDGTYNVTIYAINSRDTKSAPASAAYTVNLSSPSGASALSAVTALTVKGGGTTFTGTDCTVVWTDPNTNGANGVIAGYEVKVADAAAPTTIYRTEFVTTPTYTYDLTKQRTDNSAALKRTFIITVRVKDTWGRYSTATGVTFANPLPATPTGILAAGDSTAVFLSWDKCADTDYAGTLVWMSTTSGFSTGSGNLVFDGNAQSFNKGALVGGTSYYFKVAHYDTFGKDITGATGNVSAQSSGAASSPGIAKSATAPAGAEGDVYINTTDGQLYRYKSGAWTAAVPAVNITGPITSSQIASVAATQITGSILDSQLAAIAASKITGSLIDTQLSAIAASKVTGTLPASQVGAGLTAAQITSVNAASVGAGLTSTQISSVAAATVTGASWTGSQIAAGTILSGNIASGTITGTNIAGTTITGANIVGGTITAAKIATGTITANEIAGNTITGSNIAGSTITAGNLVAGTITAGYLGANAVTATNIQAGAITTDKLVVTGRGKALNDDPSCRDITAWSVGVGSFVVQADSSSPVGSYSLRATNATQILSRTYPVEAGKTYKIALWAKQVSGGGVFYIRQYSYNAAGSNITYVVNALTPATGSFEGVIVPGTWTRYVGYITPAAGCVYAQILLHVNWNTIGVTDLTDIRAEEYIGADLIVDGSISASKLVADSITATQIAANAITSSELAANSVIAGKILAGSISATEIAAGTITATQIAANTITGNNIAANSITATNINTNGLLIRDGSGNIILGAGNALPIGYAPSGTLNSNVSLGTLGYTGATNATYVVNTNQLTDGAGLGTTANWSAVANNDGNRPQNGATVGATFGSNVYGQITSGNASTYIASAAINSAQVGTINANQVYATSLSAITATVGTLRTASSGQRTEIQDNRIRVYDSGNVLRVKIGDLS